MATNIIKLTGSGADVVGVASRVTTLYTVPIGKRAKILPIQLGLDIPTAVIVDPSALIPQSSVFYINSLTAVGGSTSNSNRCSFILQVGNKMGAVRFSGYSSSATKTVNLGLLAVDTSTGKLVFRDSYQSSTANTYTTITDTPTDLILTEGESISLTSYRNSISTNTFNYVYSFTIIEEDI